MHGLQTAQLLRLIQIAAVAYRQIQIVCENSLPKNLHSKSLQLSIENLDYIGQQ